jgi:hypothetical protein
MLRDAIASWFRPAPKDTEPAEGRTAYHSDIRAIRPDAWSTDAPTARGADIERALWLSGVSSHDFAQTVDIALAPDRVTPVDDIVAICGQRAAACQERADALTAELPPPNPFGRPPLPWHRTTAREASHLHRAAGAWRSLQQLLLSNRWRA